MQIRKASRWRLLSISGLAVGLGALAAVQQSCMRRVDTPESQLRDSQVETVQSAVRVFRRLIGRDPGPKEIQAVKNLAYPDLVKAVLNSQQFDAEGYYNLHRERFLLNREGSATWVKTSYDDYCALRLEVAERAAADRAGDYFDILRYRERWIPLASTGLDECFFGTSVAGLLAVKAMSEEQQANLTPKQQLAKSCLDNLQWSLPNDDNQEPEQVATAFFATLEGMSDEQKSGSLLNTAEGEKLFNRLVRDSMFPRWGSEFPEDAPTQPGDLKIEVVRKDGKASVLQEFGTAGNQQCLFASIDPAEFVPTWMQGLPDQPPGGDLGAGGTEGDGLGDGPVVLPEPIFFDQPFLGEPTEPVLSQPETATTPGMALAGDAKPRGRLYVKVKMPPEFMGVHASPYWLSRHPSKPKNRNLHRARVVYFSHFCADINPDAANFVGPPVTEFPEQLRPYFAPDDNHVKGSQNCYNCHTKVQPLANFFGLTSWGTQYDSGFGEGGEGDEEQNWWNWPEYASSNAATYRPGGIYDGQNFFPVEGTDRGMEGLANVLTKYPSVKKCVADSTWAVLAGRDFPLWEEERAAALAAFEKDGKPSLTRLVAHFMLENKRGQTLFGKGEAAFAAMKPQTEFQCPDEVTPEIEAGVQAVAKSACKTCHEGEFITEDGKFDFDHYFSEGNDEDTPETRGALVQNLYCKVKMEKMPPGGSGAQLDKSKRGAFWCNAMRLRDKLADAGKIPTEYKGKACPGAPLPAAGMSPAHMTGNQPGN